MGNEKIQILQEDLQKVLQDPELDAMKLRDLWLIKKTDGGPKDKFRDTLFSLFTVHDAVDKKSILEEYERMHGAPCKISDHVMRQLVREIAERVSGDSYVLKGLANTTTGL